jgi:hypothetical protein
MDFSICSRCHKRLSKDKFLRKNYKNTGEIREFKICNECNLNKLKLKVNKINVDFNNKYNFISPYNNEPI